MAPAELDVPLINLTTNNANARRWPPQLVVAVVREAKLCAQSMIELSVCVRLSACASVRPFVCSSDGARLVADANRVSEERT